MPSSNPEQRFQDIVYYIDEIANDLKELSKNEFLENRTVVRSVSYSIQCISEASIKLGDKAVELCPGHKWEDIRGMGNYIRHDYDDYNMDIVWETANNLETLRADCIQAIEIIKERERNRYRNFGDRGR